jgi:hypothetical protein
VLTCLLARERRPGEGGRAALFFVVGRGGGEGAAPERGLGPLALDTLGERRQLLLETREELERTTMVAELTSRPSPSKPELRLAQRE